MAQTQTTRTESSQELDIVDIIMEDHKLLKELIETLKDSEAELDERRDAFEGEVEHILADQLLEEEESDLLPEFRKSSEPQQRAMLAEQFIDLKTELLMEGGDDSKPEAEIEAETSLESEDEFAAH